METERTKTGRAKCIAVTAVLCMAAFMTMAGQAAFAEERRFNNTFSMTVPDGWNVTYGNYGGLPPELAAVFDGAALEEPLPVAVGWKTEADGKGIVAAFSIKYIPQGMDKLVTLLNKTHGNERAEIASQFADSFAGKFHQMYERDRHMQLENLTAELIEAEGMYVMFVDMLVKDGKHVRNRASTVFLKNEKMVDIGWMYNTDCPAELVKQLEEMPISIVWAE